MWFGVSATLSAAADSFKLDSVRAIPPGEAHDLRIGPASPHHAMARQVTRIGGADSGYIDSMINHLFLGSIGVLADTSELQRQAYNRALAEAGVGWHWDRDTYRQLLGINGGKKRLRMLADATGTDLSDDQIDRIHGAKTDYAGEMVRQQASLRPGIAALIEWCRDNDVRVSLVTSTYRPNVEAIADAAGDELDLDEFTTVITTEDVERGKPAPDPYERALERTGAHPDEVLAIEDTASSTLAAVGAGLRVVTTPGSLTDDQIIVGAALVLDSLAGSDDGLNPQLVELLRS